MLVMVVMPTDGPVYMVEVVFFCYFFCVAHSLGMPILASCGPLAAPMGLVTVYAACEYSYKKKKKKQKQKHMIS